MDKVSIDFASHDDIEPMADLLHELFSLEQDFSPDRVKQKAALRFILDNPSLGRLFVLRADSELAGMANALVTVSTAEGGSVLLLEDVIVKAAYRGRGLGRQLVEHVCQWASGQGLRRVTLLADKANDPALGFYRHLGFSASAMQVLRRPL